MTTICPACHQVTQQENVLQVTPATVADIVDYWLKAYPDEKIPVIIIRTKNGTVPRSKPAKESQVKQPR